VLDGPIDTTVPTPIGDELVTTLREALSNVARHAQATAVDVEVTVGTDVLVRVHDDGVGLAGAERPAGHGMRNMAERAARLGGTFATTGAADGGTIVTWRVPLAPS
ncbi:MAG TPA: ATP-binding protein, partial [Ilumatobacteraceae bacterium]|nr:ATP-binding protein [Ilumatobacteraceae bacterium]